MVDSINNSEKTTIEEIQHVTVEAWKRRHPNKLMIEAATKAVENYFKKKDSEHNCLYILEDNKTGYEGDVDFEEIAKAVLDVCCSKHLEGK